MDRDAEIRELKAAIADLRAGQEELPPQPVADPSPEDEVARVRSQLSGVDVHTNSAGRLTIDIPSTVTFDSGSVELKGASHRVLREVADLLKRDYPDRRIYVQGHTDDEPIAATKARFRDNRHLSVERADAVARFLVATCKLPERSVVVAGFGPHDPIEYGATESARARNRRVEIVVGEPLD